MNFEQMKAVYEMVKAIYNKEERLVIGKEKLHLTHGINKNSFADFYRAFQKMLDGELHTRGISTDLRDFYLSQIYEDYGTKKLETALNAYIDFIIYYEKKHNNIKKKNERKIYQKHYELIKHQSPERKGRVKVVEFYEGEFEQVFITKHERNTEARNKCIQAKGVKCVVCDFDFEKTYGELGKGFIHVHHINPISTKDGNYAINIENELVPVCPNCHAMLHRRKDKILSIEELKRIFHNK